MKHQELQKLQSKVLEALTILSKKDTVILGISGGPDSTFLWHFLQQNPCKVIPAHLNHQLRGEESQEDQEFIKSLDPNAEIKSINILQISKENKENLEDTARKERYNFFQKLAEKHQAKYILTAHHADDSLESILLHMSRGSNLEGLLGINPIHKNIFRPLLQITKKEIIDYLQTKSIPYRQDSSNQDQKYKRNLLRHQVIPLLQKINSNIAKTTTKNHQNLRQIHHYIQQTATNWIKKNYQKNQFSRTTFLQEHIAIQKQIIIEIHRLEVKHNLGIQTINIEEILELINKNIGNKKKQFGEIIFSLKNQLISVQKIKNHL